MDREGIWSRRVVLALTCFVAVTAIAGGIALATGMETRFSESWLAGTPFSTYVIPGLLLAAVVGGSSLVASLMQWRRHRSADAATVVAGVVLTGWIVGEILIYTADGTGATAAESFYLVLGFAIAVVGVLRIRVRDASPSPLPGTSAHR
jgi:hypothetical protein